MPNKIRAADLHARYQMEGFWQTFRYHVDLEDIRDPEVREKARSFVHAGEELREEIAQSMRRDREEG